MRRNLLALAIIFSVVLNLTFAASYAWRVLQERSRFTYQELNLTAGQRARFEAGRTRFLAAVNRTGNAMIARNVELIDLIAAEPADDAAIQAKLAEMQATSQSMHGAVVQHLLEDKEILDERQRRQFFEILKARVRAQGAPGPPWLPPGARVR